MARPQTVHSPLLDRLRDRMKGQPHPMVLELADGEVSRSCPGASLWTGGIELAGALERLGLERGDRLLLRLPNGIDFIQLMLACLRTGVVFCPLPASATDDDLSRATAELGPRLVIDAPKGPLEALTPLRTGALELRAEAARDPYGAAWILHTSGTSGERRAIALSEETLLQQIASHAPHLAPGEATEAVSFLSWAHAFGAVIELLCGLENQLVFSLPCRQRFDLEVLVTTLLDVRAESFCAVPGVVRQLVDHPAGARIVRRLRSGVIGGAPVSPALADWLTEHAPGLRVGYGQTELGPGVMLGPVGTFRPGLIGRPVGCEVKTDDQNQLYVRGDNLALAAVTGPELAIEDGWLATGDLVTRDPDGLYRFLGRVTRCWKWSNGKRFNPMPTEEALSESLGCEVLLLKAEGDEALPVVITDSGVPTGLPGPRLSRPVPLHPHDALRCSTASGKWSPLRVANHLRSTVPGISLDPVLYPVRPVGLGAGHRLTPAAVAEVVLRGQPVEIGPVGRERIAECHQFALAKAATPMPIYGWKTGFGPHVVYGARETPEDQGQGLLCHLQAGQGPAFPAEIARAVVLVRLHTAAQGHSGLSPECADWLERAVNLRLAPSIPSLGSVGASGDLVPMSHAVAGLRGECALLDGAFVTDHGLGPLELRGRDALALVNGTPVMSAIAALAVVRFRRALAASLRLSAHLYELIGAHHQPLHGALHAGSNHRTHEVVARRFRDELRLQSFFDPERPLQESYSVRCAPQLLGAALTALQGVEKTVERELNGISDNPFFDVEADAVVHGGNFFGQEIGFAMDALLPVVVQVGNLLERQIAFLAEPRQTGLNLLLSPRPGEDSGFAGVQLQATAALAEMRRRAVPSSMQSLPTNGLNQDIVPMGTHAAWNVYQLLDLLEPVLGALGAAVRQAAHLSGRPATSDGGRPLRATLEAMAPLERDRPLAEDVRTLAQALLFSPETSRLAQTL